MGVVGYQGSKLKSRGLGDTIANVAKATGVATVIDKVSKATGKDCGCKKRKKKSHANISRGPNLGVVARQNEKHGEAK